MELAPWHVGISVSDLEISVPWYTRTLGFSIARRNRAEALAAELCFLERDGFELELFQYDRPAPLPEERRQPNTDLRTLGTKHLAFRVDHMERWLEHLRSLGADIAHETTMAGKKVVFIRDPDGILIELIQPADSVD